VPAGRRSGRTASLKILFVTPYYAATPEHGGIPTVVRGLARGLARSGHEVTVLTDDAAAGHCSNGAPSAAQLVVLPGLLRYRSSSVSRGAARFCRQHLDSYDAVHIVGGYHLLGALVARACRRKGIPYIVEPSGMLPITGRGRVRKHVYQRLVGDRLLVGASAVIAVGERERHGLAGAGVDPARIVVRRNGIEVEAFRNLPAAGDLRSALDIRSSAQVVLFVGRLDPIKGIDLLLDGFPALPSETHLVLVGPLDDRRYVARLQRQRAQLGLAGRVHFAGPRHGPALLAALADADVLVLPSRRECFGVAAAEAVGAGVPVVVSSAAGIASLIDGRAGLVVAPEPQEIAAAVGKVLADGSLRARLQQGGRALASTLSWDEPVAIMAALYASLRRTGTP
jgi:glycosyltransferase involved in cell wall biosynthesis